MPIVSLLIISLLLLPPQRMSAAPSSSPVDQCADQVISDLEREHRFFRAVLYGQEKAGDELEGAVHYDTQWNAWTKIGRNRWESAEEEAKGATRTDAEIDQEDLLSGTPVRHGIFETPFVLTWELIPMLTQSYRAFQCRAESICVRALQSYGKVKDTEFTLQVPGCIPFTVKPLPACTFDQTEQYTSLVTIRDNCQRIARDLLSREADLLKLAVAYDSAYRSLLLLAGSIDRFRSVALGPLEYAVALFGQFNRLPCFLSQCDE